MTLQGDIQSFSLAAINRMIHVEKKTGKLDVAGDRHHAIIYYQKGFIVFIDSDLTQAFSLGSLLLTHNIIGEQEIRKALEIAESEDKRLGVILVQLGHISQKKLINLLRYQFKEIISKVLAWSAGTFSYTEGLTDYAEDIRFKIDPVRLLSEAQKWRQYRDLIPDDWSVFKISESSFYSESSFEESILRVLLLINGKRTITQIIAETGYSRLAVYKAVKQLVSRSAIVRKDTEVVEKHFDPAQLLRFYLDIIKEIMGVIALELGKRKSLECLQSSLINSRQYDTFLKSMPVDADARKQFASMHNFLKENGNIVSEQDLFNGLDNLVSGLLSDVKQLLGDKSYTMTVDRIDYPALIQNRAKYSAADKQPEYLLRNDSTIQRPGHPDDGIKNKRKNRQSDAGERSEADQIVILLFFSKAIHILVKDLENEIGLQAFAILQGILEGSETYPDFIAQFDVADDIERNVDRVAGCIKKECNIYESEGLATICTQVLSDIVNEERGLLGNRAVQVSLDKIEEETAAVSTDRLRKLLKNMVIAIRN